MIAIDDRVRLNELNAAEPSKMDWPLSEAEDFPLGSIVDVTFDGRFMELKRVTPESSEVQ